MGFLLINNLNVKKTFVLLAILIASCQKELSAIKENKSSESTAIVKSFSVSKMDGGYFVELNVSKAEGNNVWLEANGNGKKWTWPVDNSGDQTWTLIGFDEQFSFDVVSGNKLYTYP